MQLEIQPTSIVFDKSKSGPMNCDLRTARKNQAGSDEFAQNTGTYPRVVGLSDEEEEQRWILDVRNRPIDVNVRLGTLRKTEVVPVDGQQAESVVHSRIDSILGLAPLTSQSESR